MGEVVFGWFWVQGSGQVWGVVERLMTMTKRRIWRSAEREQVQGCLGIVRGLCGTD